MKRFVARVSLAVGFVLICAVLAQAAPITIDYVWIHETGNAADTSAYGSVAYVYAMGKTEITAGQYVAFLNAVASTDAMALYNTNMAGAAGCGITRNGSPGSYTYTLTAGYANRPVNFVNQYDGFRMANWLQNGQPTGLGEVAASTEAGTYTMSGASSTSFAPDATYRLNNYNSPSTAHWVLPTENEWYKAAYYDPRKTGGAGYWDYPTSRLDTAPTARTGEVTGGNSANYNKVVNAPNGATIDVGTYNLSASAYGTFDQAGNVSEYLQNGFSRGGAYNDLTQGSQGYSNRVGSAGAESASVGMRLAYVPEPGTIAMLIGLALVGMIYWRRPKA